MQNVAASKVFMTKKRKEATFCYANKVSEVLQHLLSYQNATNQLRYFKDNLYSKGVGYLILSSDHGLCGGLNTNLFQLVLDHNKQFNKKTFFWSLFGDQARNFFEKREGRLLNLAI